MKGKAIIEMRYEDLIETCTKCNDLLNDFACDSDKVDRKRIEEQIEKFLEENYLKLREYKEYQALFLKYVYVKEGIKNE